MKVDTRWFGTIDIDDEKIITFDLGVIGFEDCKKFTLIYDVDKGDEASIMWLQSLDEPELALPMLKPELIKEDYDPIVEDEMLKALGSDIKEADLIVFCVLTVPADITKMTINFKAPIIVNADTLKGVQLIAETMIMKTDILFIQFLKKGKVSRMLALSRKKDEAIIINDDVEVTVIEIKGDQVKLGITAPKSVPIYRKEVYVQIKDANKEATQQAIDVKALNQLFKK